MACNSNRAVDYSGNNQDDVYHFGWREGFNEGYLEAMQLCAELFEKLSDEKAKESLKVIIKGKLNRAEAKVAEDNEGLSEYE